jgi:uncharacterized protein YdhG (YjbR/CyaY superfamily)
MKYAANSPNDYIDQLPQERREVIEKIRAVILQNLPQGFEEQLSYGMLGYVVCESRITITIHQLSLTKEFYSAIPFWHLCKY